MHICQHVPISPKHLGDAHGSLSRSETRPTDKPISCLCTNVPLDLRQEIPMHSVTLKEAKEVTNQIVKTLRPFSVVLFGSVAKKRMGADLDLLIVTDERSVINDNLDLLLHRSLKKYYRKFSIDPFIVRKALLQDIYAQSPFIQKISREGRVLYMKNAVQEWLNQAKDELNMADYLLNGGYFKGTCYHAEQSIEKAIKARLLQKGWELEKTHSLARLIAIGRDYKLRFPLADDEVVFIDEIYRGRYPAEAGILPLGEPSEKDARRAAAIAKKIFKNTEKALTRGSPCNS